MTNRVRRTVVLSMLSFLTFSVPVHPQEAAPLQRCAFELTGAASTPTVTGPADIVNRVQFLRQDPAPVRILQADFTGASLSIGGSLTFTDKYLLEVVNVSDKVVTLVHPFVQLLTAGGGAMGGGPIVRGQLAPGERRWIRNEGHVAHGIAPVEDDVRIRVSIAAVKLEGCTWEDRRWLEVSATRKIGFDSRIRARCARETCEYKAPRHFGTPALRHPADTLALCRSVGFEAPGR